MSLLIPTLSAETAAGFAESLIKEHAIQKRDILPLFAAFVGVVFQRDEAVGWDCLTALDRLVSESGEQASATSPP